MTESMKYKINILIIILIFFTPSILTGEDNSIKSKNIDLSTPEKTLDVFIQAFKTGNDSLLNFVLAKNASIPEFNAIRVLL